MPRLLLTRARPQAEGFAIMMRGQTSLVPIISPMQEMRDLAVKIDLSGITALAFTSQNGVAAFARQSPARLPAYCVGEATAARARALGFEAKAAAGNMESLQKILPSCGVLHLHGRHVAGALGVQNLAIYEQVALPLGEDAQTLLAADAIAAVALFSPRSARLWAESPAHHLSARPVLYALSEAVAAPLRGISAPRICPAPNATAMLRLLSADFPA